MSSRKVWMARARRVAMRRNLASWLDVFLPVACAISIASAAVLLVLRTWKVPTMQLWICFGAALFLAAAVGWFLTRKTSYTRADALVLLDDAGHLHNRLTAANAGIGEWPGDAKVRDRARWNWGRLFGLVGLCAILLFGAAWLQVPEKKSVIRPTDPPLAWGQVQSWLQTLEESKLIEPEALQKLREQMEELRGQPAENWYNQSSLEAGDTLRGQTEQALRAMQRDLQQSEDALAAAQKLGSTAPPAELKALNDSLQKSLGGLQLGNLPLNKELLGNLKKFDASKLKQLSSSQIAEMRAKLQAGVRVCEQCVGPSAHAKEVAGATQGGGPGGGGGPAPLTLKKEQTNLRTKQTESVSNEDLSQAVPGDVLGVDKGEHEVKKTEGMGPVAGGAIQSAGQGGEAVWRDSLTPEEREVLQRFFK